MGNLRKIKSGDWLEETVDNQGIYHLRMEELKKQLNANAISYI